MRLRLGTGWTFESTQGNAVPSVAETPRSVSAVMNKRLLDSMNMSHSAKNTRGGTGNLM